MKILVHKNNTFEDVTNNPSYTKEDDDFEISDKTTMSQINAHVHPKLIPIIMAYVLQQALRNTIVTFH